MSAEGGITVFQEDIITIQHDRQRSLEVNKNKFFVNYKKYGDKRISYDVQCEKGKLKDEIDVTGKIKAEVDGNTIKLVFDNVSKKFIPPFREFRNVHKTSINAIDISPTENLMVSSDSSGKLHKVFNQKLVNFMVYLLVTLNYILLD
uniref:Uncharacterized protein n=1 Tax=Panagrolaimus sp. JU765 TaxID=591449 RepID=A0AC34RPH3_9BILA